VVIVLFLIWKKKLPSVYAELPKADSRLKVCMNYDSKLLVHVASLLKLVENGIWVVWAKQNT
jgi:hypothetical protein